MCQFPMPLGKERQNACNEGYRGRQAHAVGGHGMGGHRRSMAQQGKVVLVFRNFFIAPPLPETC